MTLELSRNITLLILFLGLLVLKLLEFNSVIDDMLMLVIGALLGREVLSNVKTRISGTKENSNPS